MAVWQVNDRELARMYVALPAARSDEVLSCEPSASLLRNWKEQYNIWCIDERRLSRLTRTHVAGCLCHDSSARSATSLKLCLMILQEYTWMIVIHGIVAWIDAYGIGKSAQVLDMWPKYMQFVLTVLHRLCSQVPTMWPTPSVSTLGVSPSFRNSCSVKCSLMYNTFAHCVVPAAQHLSAACMARS
jgi:hypothetical protein